MRPQLSDYDWIVVNSSAGKDSQAMLDVVYALADELDQAHKLVVVHADLGRVEWEGTRALAETQAAHYGIRFEVVSRSQDLLAQIRQRGLFPSSSCRYCTSDQKRDQVAKLLTQLSRETQAQRGKGQPVRILNCMGLRAEESPSRAKKPDFTRNNRASNKSRLVDDWLPIHDWSTAQVWTRIKTSGVPHHRAYDLGMPRLSCVFCIFAPKDALMIAGRHNPDLLAEYVQVEAEIDHTFREDLSLAQIQNDIAAEGSAP